MVITPGDIIFGPKQTEYEVLEFIDNGSFGFVYKIKERNGALVFALKTIPASFTEKMVLKAFVNEGRLAVTIRHPNVIEYLFFHDGSEYSALPPYIIMEYADGGTLQNQIAQARNSGKPFSNSDLVAMFQQLVAGMKAINEKLIHRDIKPDNILISRKILKISDFGLSKVVTEATRSTSFKGGGCMPYMAPEAWRLEKNTVQLDIYSMGIVFYQLATLRRPFDITDGDFQVWRDAHLFRPIPRPDSVNVGLEPNIVQIIMKMVEKDSAKRFTNWAEIEAMLRSNTQPTTNPANLVIEKMLKRRIEQDSATQVAEAAQRKRNEELDQFCELVLSQAEQSIIYPVRELISEFNRRYPGDKASEKFESPEGGVHFSYVVNFPSRHTVSVDFRVLLEKNFVRHLPADSRHMSSRIEVCIPKFNGRRVQGWGIVQGTDGRGFNILLVERADEVYGEFVLVKTTVVSNPQTGQRIDPAAFQYTDLEQHLQLNLVSQLYSGNSQEFDIEYLRDFIASYA